MNEVLDIRLIVFDVDGVLTDGSILVNDEGIESKRFHVRDGFAIKAAQSLGIQIGILTGRSTRAVALRMTELGVDLVMQGVKNKGEGFCTLCKKAGVELGQVAYLGDDLIDLPAMNQAGYPMAVADAAVEVRKVARYVTSQPGGHGAARDAVEHLLKQMNLWDRFVESFSQ